MIGPAPAKLNLALVVGPLRADGKHELVTVFQRVDLGDRIDGRAAPARRRRRASRRHDRPAPRSRCSTRRTAGACAIEKHIPVAAGLGGGSSDAATALRLANEQLDAAAAAGRAARARRAGRRRRAVLPRATGRSSGPATGRRSSRSSCRRTTPCCCSCRTARASRRPPRSTPRSTRAAAQPGFDERAAALRAALATVRRPRDLAALPPNDLASSPLADRAPRARRVPRRRQRRRPDASTASSTEPPTRSAQRRALRAPRATSGSRYQRGTVDRDVRQRTRSSTDRRAPGAGSASGASGSRSGSPPSRGCSTSSTRSTGGRPSRSRSSPSASGGTSARGNRSDTLRAGRAGSSPPRSCSFSACRSRSRLVEGGRDRRDRAPRDRGADLPLHRAAANRHLRSRWGVAKR